MSTEKPKEKKKSSSLFVLTTGATLLAAPFLVTYNMLLKPLLAGVLNQSFETKWNNLLKEYQKFDANDEFASGARVASEMNALALKSFGKRNAFYASSLTLRGIPEYYLGNILKAKECLLYSMKMFRLTKDTENEYYLNDLTCLGMIELQLFNYKEAELFMLEALEYYERNNLQNSELYPQIKQQLACVYYNMGQFYKGDHLYSLSQNESGITNFNYMTRFHYAVSLLWRRKDDEAAAEFMNVISYLGKSAPDNEVIYLVQSYYLLAALNNISPEEADRLLSIINNKLESDPPQAPPLRETIQTNCAYIYYRRKKYDTAIKTMEQVLQNSYSTETSPYLQYDLHFLLAQSYAQVRNLDSANKQFKEALIFAQKMFSKWFIEMNQNDKFIYLSNSYKLTSLVEEFLIEHHQKYPDLTLLLFEYRLKTKNFLYFDYLQLEQLYTNYAEFLDNLREDEAYIEILRSIRITDNHKIVYLVFVTTRETKEHPELIILDNGEELEQKAYSSLINLVEHKSIDMLSYKRYWEKIDQKISSKKRIYFAPDGIFRVLNIEILYKSFSQPAIEGKEFIYCNSINSIVNRNSTMNFEAAILFGNPKFISTLENESEVLSQFALRPIPESEIEVNNIHNQLCAHSIQSKIMSRDLATKPNLMENINNSVLHIATHGIQLPIDSQDTIDDYYQHSGILLSDSITVDLGIPRLNCSGILTADEILQLDLKSVELTALSSCVSGIGAMRNTGDMVGFPLALLSGGCRFALVSLWWVDDNATKEMFSLFYEKLIVIKDPVLSLRLAKDIMREQYRSPYYWGGFIIISR